MSLGQNIKRLRCRSGLRTQRALADLLGVPQPQVSDWENDRYSVLGTLTLVRIAKGIGCSIDELLLGVDPDYDRVREAVRAAGVEPAPADLTVETLADVPVVAEGAASPGGVIRDDGPSARTGVVQWVSRPGDLRDPGAYGVRVCGDSMMPAYRPNTIAIMAPGRRVRDDDEVYVQLGSGERLIRLFQTVRGGCLLQAYNPAYGTLLVQRKDIRAMDVVVSSRLADL